MSKSAFYRLRWQIAQNVCSRLASEYGFSKYSGKVVYSGRNRPQFAVRAQCGLFGTSMSRNCWVSNRNIKKISYSFARHFANILRNLPAKVYGIAFDAEYI